jgi:cytochrome c biogenesis factor
MSTKSNLTAIVALSIGALLASTSIFTPVSNAKETKIDNSKLTLNQLAPIFNRRISIKDNYAALWDKSASSAWVARHGMTSDQYQAEFDKYVGQGYRLVQVSGYGLNGKDYYAAIWDKSPSAAWVARHRMTSAEYQAEFDKYVGQGYRLVQVSGYGVNGKDYYAAIWDKSPSTAWVARHGMTSDQYQAEFDKYVGQGYRLVQVSGYGVNGKDYYAAIWDKSPSGAWVARHRMTSAQYQAEFDKYVGQGYRLVQVSGYRVNGSNSLYAAIWSKSNSPAWVARHGLTSAQYQAEFDKNVGQGYRLVQVSGY